MTAPPPTRRPFAGLVAGYLISVLGTAMSAVAIPWLVLITTGSAARTGLVGFAEMAPYVAFQALSGPLVDRVGARRCCVLGNLAAAVAVGAIPALSAAGALRLGALAACVAVAGAVRGIADAATNPLVPGAAALGAIPPERAAGLSSGANRAGLMLGAPLAGVLIAVTGPPAVILVDALSFAVAAALFAALVPRAAQPDTATGRLTPRAYLADLGAGLRFLRADRLLLGIVTTVAVANLLDTALQSVLLPVWVHDRLHDPRGLGFVGGVTDVGALLGVLAGAWLGPRLPRRVTYGVGSLLGGAPRFAVLALSTALAPVLAVGLFCGAAGGVVNPVIGAVSYERIPAELRARVLGAIKASAWLGIPFGSLVGGALTATAGLATTLYLAGGLYLLVTVAPFVLPAWRGLDVRTSRHGAASTV